MAPEYALGDVVTPQVDMYAVGITLYELLCGVAPFVGGNPMAVLHRQISHAATPPQWLDPRVWELLEQLLAKHPSDRPTASVAAIVMARLAEEVGDVAALPALTLHPHR